MLLSRSKSNTYGGDLSKMNSNSGSNSPMNGRGQTDSDRARSRSFADKIITARDSCNFQIPPLTPPGTPPEVRSRSKTLIEDFDLSLYEPKKENQPSKLLETNEQEGGEKPTIGRIKCLISHQKLDNKISVEILNAQVTSYPSSFVKGHSWICNPLCAIDIHKLHYSPTITRKTSSAIRKTSVFQTISHQKIEQYFASVGDTCIIPFKHRKPTQFSIRITLYDRALQHKDLALGYVHVPVSEIFETDSALNVDQEVVSHSEPFHSNHGKMQNSIRWDSYNNVIYVEVKRIHELQKYKGTNGKELYMKATLFNQNEEIDDYKSDQFDARYDVKLNHIFQIYVNHPNTIENTAILLQVIEKHLVGQECIGQTLIGPYMPKTISNNTLSCWEKIIIDPNMRLDYEATLFL